MRAWTYFYMSFTMGGDVHQPHGFEFDQNKQEEVNLGEGYAGYVLTSPNGKTIVVEKTSGAIVGNSLEEVEADICGAALVGQQDIMRKQVEKAMNTHAKIISEAEFWQTYERAKN